MKQTAVEWLVDELQKAEWIPKDSLIINFVIDLAKEKEKEQLKEIYLKGIENYDPTFKKK
jgi:hypothetical protein